ncbi:MAG: hypothetical protein LAO76_23350 [Acidobacteriia bacterium]|nr:hypothetical protein [Terriglobia bacterium]
MAGVEESAGTTAKILEILKDLPLWLLFGLAISAGALLLFPGIAASVPATARPWIIVGGVVFAALAVARGIGILIHEIPAWKASAEARRRFHLIAIPQQSHWSSSKQADDSIVTQVAIRFLVKNRTANPLALVNTRLISPRIRGEILHDDVSLRAVDRNIYGSAVHSGHVIPPNTSLPASVTIMIRGVPRKKVGKEVRVTIGVRDDEGHEQRANVNVRVISASQATAAVPSLEVVSSIPNPIEREIAAVLQSELARYDKCGRIAGGLGSIHLIVNGREMTGVGNDSWNPNSPKNQSISNDPNASQLRSDNLEALLVFYDRLVTPHEQDQFVKALIARLDGKDYLRVSYFIVCVLWKVGHLQEALERAKAELPQGEIKVFGLSNTLMLLNGLLRYRYPDFTNSMLDDIEKFVHGLSEHPFQIPEKIAAIRTARLMGPKT